MSDNDEMMMNLVKIANSVHSYPHRQTKRLIMSRNDFMVEEENNAFYQVEYNLIAAALGPISQGGRKVHTLLNVLTKEEDSNEPLDLKNSQCFIEAFKCAHKAYGNPDAVIVAIKDNGNSLFDHLFMIEELLLSG